MLHLHAIGCRRTQWNVWPQHPAALAQQVGQLGRSEVGAQGCHLFPWLQAWGQPSQW